MFRINFKLNKPKSSSYSDIKTAESPSHVLPGCVLRHFNVRLKPYTHPKLHNVFTYLYSTYHRPNQLGSNPSRYTVGAAKKDTFRPVLP